MHGTRWQMGHNSRHYPFRTRGASILPTRIDSYVWHWSFSHFRCQNNKKYIPILWEVLVTHEYPDLRMSFNYLTGQNRDNKRALHRHKVAIAARELCFDRSRPTIPPSGNVSKLYRFKLRLWMSKHDIFPIPLYFVQQGAEECVFGSRRKLKVSVLSANFKKCRFCNFTGS